MKQCIILLMFASVISGCLNIEYNKSLISDRIDIKKISVNIGSPIIMPASKIVDSSSIEVVTLKCKVGNTIGYIEKAETTGDRIYVLDRSLSHGLFIFNERGEFINAINKSNKTQINFKTLCDFSIDEVNGELNVLADADKILLFDKNGRFKKSFQINFRALRFLRTDDNKYLFYAGFLDNKSFFNSSKNYNVILTSSEGRVEAYDMEYDADTINAADVLLPYTIGTRINKEIYINIPNRNSVYVLKDRMLIPEIKYSFKATTLKTERIMSQVGLSNKLQRYLNSPFEPGRAYYTKNNYSLIGCSDKGESMYCLINKNTGNVISFKGIANDYNYLPLALPVIGVSKDKMICYFRSNDLLIMYNKMAELGRSNPEKVRLVRSIYDSCQSNELILVKFSLKSDLEF